MPDPTHVLLVDDDAFNREGMRLYFQREGLAVTEAGDAATAWAAAQSHPLDAAMGGLGTYYWRVQRNQRRALMNRPVPLPLVEARLEPQATGAQG